MNRAGIRAAASAASIVVLALMLSACQSPQEKAMAVRSQYLVQLNTWLLKEPEPAPAADPAPAPAAGAPAAGAPAADAPAADPAAAPVEPVAPAGPRQVEVLFDLVISQQGSEGLPGITLDISQADPFQKEKKTYRHYVELGPMVKGQAKQVAFSIQADDFVDGDVFSVVLEKQIAEADRAAYRELQ